MLPYEEVYIALFLLFYFLNDGTPQPQIVKNKPFKNTNSKIFVMYLDCACCFFHPVRIDSSFIFL